MDVNEAESEHPFDAIALNYDATFTHHQLGRWLRELVWLQLEDVFAPGDHILELGCGTGEDAVWLARREVRVTATDASPAMLSIARQKAEEARVNDLVDFRLLDLESLGSGESGILEDQTHFDGALSNFGALNCVSNRRRKAIATALARWIRPGGHVGLVLMGPFCPWEILWHLGHGQPRAAIRRWRSDVLGRVGDGAAVRVWYPSPRRLRAEFAHDFQLVRTVGIGALLPPSYLAHLTDRWPQFFYRAAALDSRVGQSFPWTWLNDHYLTIFERG